MDIKKYDKVPLNQLPKSNDIKLKPELSNTPKKEEIIIQKSKSIVFIKNKKSITSEKSFTKEEFPQIPLFFIRTKDNCDLKINFDQVSHFTILELKRFSFPLLFEENKNIRFIFRGKLLKDNEIVSKSINIGDFIHAFISEKVDKKSNATSANTTNISNFENSRANAVRGFERMRQFGISEQEMVLQRFRYHSYHTLIEKEENIELTNLINREDEWYAINLDQITINPSATKNWFKTYDFYNDIKNELNLKGNYLEMFLGGIIGFFVLILVFLFIFCHKKISSKAKEGMVIGVMIKITYISVNFYLSGAIKWLI